MRLFEILSSNHRADLYRGVQFDVAENALSRNVLRGGHRIYPYNPDDPDHDMPLRGQDRFLPFIKFPKIEDVLNLTPAEKDILSADAGPMNSQERVDHAYKKREIRLRYEKEIDRMYPKRVKSVPGTRFSRSAKIASNFGPIIFVIDQDKLVRDYGRRLSPDWDDKDNPGSPYQRSTGNSESEEVLMGEVKPLSKYLKDIILIRDDRFPKDLENRNFPNLIKWLKHFGKI